MTEVVIRNNKLLASLNAFKDELFSIDGYDDPSYESIHPTPEDKYKGEYYCSEEWLNHKLANWEEHSGFPEECYSMQYTVKKEMQGRPNEKDLVALRMKTKDEFTKEIGATQAALFSYYPSGGYVGWHTNWNANAYQILFTWSETGNGYFKYYDKQKKEIVTVHDVPGWQCRHYYFGRKDEFDHHCWHAAYTEGPRITFAYKFENNRLTSPLDATARMMRDQLIDEIESEE